ncbi:unnamed protein product [Effrenium voratum]|nr:unnamed protein product [Effrenium voratum]
MSNKPLKMTSFAVLLALVNAPHAAAAPDWCKWVPPASLQYVGECSGAAPAPQQGGFGYGDGPDGCVNWCVWVPGKDWHQTNECKRCAEYYPVEPMGAHAGCEGWCQWVSQPSWHYMDNCRGCNANQALVKAAVPDSSGSAKLAGKKPGLKTKSRWADWCKWVPPSSLQYVGECSGGRPATQGSHTGGRPDWCQWVPAASLQYVGECSGATPSTQGNAGTGHPEWCSRVPAGSLQYVPECSSLAPTTQHGNAGGHPEWCSRVPAASLQYVPECSGLAPATQQGNQPQRPDWCKWVPAASVQYVDQCSGNFAPAQGAGDAGWGYGDGPEGCVNWCVWVPGNKWHERDDCKKCAEYYPVEPQGFAHAGCAGWCQWVSQPSWQYVGNCRGCNANQAAVKAAMPNSSASAKPTGSYSLHFCWLGWACPLKTAFRDGWGFPKSGGFLSEVCMDLKLFGW